MTTSQHNTSKQDTTEEQQENDPMATPNNAGPVFYPAFCFKASPTHFAWVKMAAVDVHRLRRQRGFEGEF